MTINLFNLITNITRARRAAVLATAALGLSMVGTAVAQPAAATPPTTCNGLPILPANQVQPGVAFVGTAASEVIGGTMLADNIDGGGGNDTICGWKGNDVIDGGENYDWISGGADNDTIRGWGGADWLFGNENNDYLYGGDQNDVLRGGDDVDSLSGGNDDDWLHCGLGSDTHDGGPHVAGDRFESATNHGCEIPPVVNVELNVPVP